MNQLKSEKWEYKKCLYCLNNYPSLKSNKNSKYCSKACQAEWQKENFKGSGNPRFNSITKRCDNCGNYHFVQPNKLKLKQEKYFCSVQCRQHWFGNIFSQTDEFKEKSRNRAIMMLESGTIGDTQTGCQKSINSLLNNMGIRYVNDYNFDYYSIDNFLIDNNLGIEVMGTFWHCDHRYYDEIAYDMQFRGIKNDKRKRTYFMNNYNINFLYLWEHDIINNLQLCESLIEEYIHNNGEISDYNSFNYTYLNNSLSLNETVTYPYFYLGSEDIKKIKNIKEMLSKTSRKDSLKYIAFDCEFCGSAKEQLRSVYDKALHHFCSKKCGVNYYRKIENYNPKYDKSKHISFNCEVCGDEKTQNLKHYSRAKNHFCGQKCANEFKKINIKS